MAKISGSTAAGSAAALKSLLDDVAEVRTQLIALLQKLDLDAGITDVNYESLLTPAALTTTK